MSTLLRYEKLQDSLLYQPTALVATLPSTTLAEQKLEFNTGSTTSKAVITENNTKFPFSLHLWGQNAMFQSKSTLTSFLP